MGIELSPQGILTTLISVAVAVLAYINRGTLAGLIPKLQTHPDAHTPGATEVSIDVATPHVLDVMKVLTAINERDRLGCEEELTEMYAKIVKPPKKIEPVQK